MPLIETKGAASAQGFGEFAKTSAANYIEDVFSTYLYTGNGSTQTITNGIDLAGNGGLVWIKRRDTSGYDHCLFDTIRGVSKMLQTNNTTASQTITGYGVTTFSATGFSVTDYATTGYGVNETNALQASWTFREQAKFFDVVTYTGNGSNRTIAHSLGSVPGCILVKRTDTTGDWQVYHRSLANTEYIVLNSTAAKVTGTTRWNSTTPTSTEFSLGTDVTVNANGGTYVAYLFAHDAGGFGLTGADNVISCGSYTGPGGVATIDLGYEPQWVLIKNASSSSIETRWYVFDNMRGFVANSNATSYYLAANSSSEETGIVGPRVTSTGFTVPAVGSSMNSSGDTYIYIAIRRGPMKTPTDATKVFTPTVYTGTNVDNRLVNTTIAPDMVWVRQRNDSVLGGMVVGDRLRAQPYLLTGTTAAEVNDANAFDAQVVSATEYGNAFSSMNGFWCGNDATAKLNANTTSNNHIAEAFKRAPGFFDMVCYAPTNTDNQVISHNLGVKPELVIIKQRVTYSSINRDWAVGSPDILGLNSNTLSLNNNYANGTLGYNLFFGQPTSTVVTLHGNENGISTNGATYVMYLFATLAGVSKVSSYTGTGTTKQIDCGFTGGARFVLIKRTDSTGDWYVWDSARGIVAGNDPYLLLNSTAAEVTNTDYVDTYSAGFEISSTAPAAINANGGSFIFLAIA